MGSKISTTTKMIPHLWTADNTTASCKIRPGPARKAQTPARASSKQGPKGREGLSERTGARCREAATSRAAQVRGKTKQ